MQSTFLSLFGTEVQKLQHCTPSRVKEESKTLRIKYQEKEGIIEN